MVQGSPSLQVPDSGCVMHVPEEQTPFRQGWSRLVQFFAGPGTHCPLEQVSFSVQASLSALQEPIFGCLAHEPPMHTPVLQVSPGQFICVPWQVPPWQVSLVVQGSESLQEPLFGIPVQEPPWHTPVWHALLR